MPTVLQAANAGNKFAARGWGPFEVVEVINDVALRLKLPPAWRIHPVVHTSFLSPWRDGSATFPDREPAPPDPEIIDDEEHYAVEAFLAKRTHRRRTQFLVKWVGRPDEFNEWVNADQLLEDMPEAFYTFRDRLYENEAATAPPQGPRRTQRNRAAALTDPA